jgi:predicted metal-dependent hydrolase
MQELPLLLHAGKPLPYAVRVSPRARNVSVTVTRDGTITLVLPRRGVSMAAALRFLRRQADWAIATAERMARFRDQVFLPRDRRDYLRHREAARRFVHACLAKHRPVYGVVHGRVAIKDLTRNWGSCSTGNNLNFNYKIVHLPERCAEYVVIHELCHLLEFNHSPRFWQLVARACPDHRAIRKEMRKYVP